MSELKPLGKSTRRPPGVLCRALLFDVLTGIHSTVPTQIRIPILAYRLHVLDGANPEIAIALGSSKLQRTRSGLFQPVISIDSLSVIVITTTVGTAHPP